jgi:tryptophanyl-tRNA synthetase
VQSQVPAHAELHWLLEATAYDGELRRMVQYKEKAAKQQPVRSALLAYPVLMAADILLYDVETVPVGGSTWSWLATWPSVSTRRTGRPSSCRER